MNDHEALALPKSHPARFMHFYGSSVQKFADEAERMVFLAALRRNPPTLLGPFALDLAACAETNS